MKYNSKKKLKSGFSLVEVVLAIGVLSLAIISLLGLFAPTMTAVRDVVVASEAEGIYTAAESLIQTDTTQSNSPHGIAVDYDVVTGWASGGNILCCWVEKPINESDPLAKPSSIMIVDGGKNGTAGINAFKDAIESSTTSVVESDLYIVAISQSGLTYDYGNAQFEGYLPYLISVYSVDYDTLNASGFGLSVGANGLDLSSSDISESNLIISRNAVRNR